MPFHSHDYADPFSIVGIPAIGADPEKTWGETADTQWLGPRLFLDFPKARVLLWDHLNPAERAVSPNEWDAYHEASRNVSRLRVQEWADRLVEGLEEERAHVVRGILAAAAVY